MSDPSEKFKINLNQNLWVLIVSYAAVGFSQKYGFQQLWWLSFVVACVATLSVLICVVFYSINYCGRKWKNDL